jgi:hypothetical protein
VTTTLNIPVLYGNLYGGYSLHDQRRLVGGKDWAARIPAQVALVNSSGAWLFFAVECHEETGSGLPTGGHKYLLSKLQAADPDWALSVGNGGNHCFYRPSKFAAVTASSHDFQTGRSFSDFTLREKVTSATVRSVLTHFMANDTNGTKRDKERESEAKELAAYVTANPVTFFVGDFNSSTESSGYPRATFEAAGWKGLRERGPVVNGKRSTNSTASTESYWIEDIWTRSPVKVSSSALVLTHGASDHNGWLKTTLSFDVAYTPPVTPVPPSPGPDYVDPRSPGIGPGTWKFAAGPWQGLPTTELSDATARSVTWRLRDSGEASLTLPGLSPQAGRVEEMISDLWVMWNDHTLFRGRFGTSSDAGTGDGISAQFGVADYKALLQRRFLWEGDTLTYTNADQSDIAWGLISATQAKVGGNLNIVRGLGQSTGVVRDRSAYLAGDSIGATLDLLSGVLDGFDYDFAPTVGAGEIHFNLYYPQRGQDRGRVLDYGGRVASFTRQVDPSTFGNAVRATGVDTLAAVRAEASGLATDPAGRWDLQYAEQSVTVASTLAAKAAQTLASGQYVLPSWTVTLPPGTWGGPNDVWLGDQVTLVVKAGRLNVVESLRVYEIGLALDENDVDTITITLGAPNPALRRSQRSVSRRLNALERR